MQAVTTPSSDAADSLSKAVTSFIYRQPDTTHHLQKALEHDPQFALAHAVSGLMLFGARSVSLTSLAHDALLKDIEALELVLSGQLKAAVKRYETILETHPTDALALALAQSELFWLGPLIWLSGRLILKSLINSVKLSAWRVNQLSLIQAISGVRMRLRTSC